MFESKTKVTPLESKLNLSRNNYILDDIEVNRYKNL